MPKHSREITLSPPPSQPAADPPYLFAAATAVVIFAIYALTLSPTTAFWDTSEYIAAAKVLGIPHPPGNPLFVVLAHVWGLLPIAANYAKRINYFAAFTSAAGAGFWFLIAERWLRRILPARGPRLAAAFAGIFAAAVTWTVWNQSTVNEKVYTVSMLSIALIVWCMVLWADMPDSPRRNGLLILAAYLTALTSTNHQMGVLALPAIGMYVLLVEPRLRLKPWVMLMAWVLIFGASGILGDALTVLLNGGTFSNPVWALTSKTTMDGASAINALIRITALLGVVAIGAWGIVRDRRNPLLYVGVLAVIAGLALNYVWLPLRAAQHPALNEGEPTGFFSQALSDVLNRVQYAKAPVTQRMSPFSAQLSMYWHYWSWQWSRDIGGLKTLATGIFTALCAWGATKLVRRERRGGVVAATMLITLTVLLIFYLNFRYQYGTPGIPGVDQEVRQRDYFFVASFAFSGVLLAAGFAAAIRAVADWLGDRVGEPRRWIAGTPVLLLALIPLIGNRLSAPRNHETLAGDFAVDMLQSVAPYGILITQGDNDTFPLWFAQEVLGVRRDVTLANLSLMSTDWHLNQLKRRATPMFDPGGAAKVWQRGSDSSAIPLTGTPATRWTRPTESVLAQQSQGQIDSLQQQYRVTPGDSVQLGKDLWAKWGEDTITRSDVATLFLIQDNLGMRPIYFSWTDGPYPDGEPLDLKPYLVSEGLVRELMPERVKLGGPIVDSALGLMNLPLTRSLLFGVYHPESAAHARPLGWFDPPSAGILCLYASMYGNAAQPLQQAGDEPRALAAQAIVERIGESLPTGCG